MLLHFKTRKRAVAYYRHSAEDKQENSVAIQRDHAIKFAAASNIEIIHEEADEGKSGLSANRPGFKNLFNNWILDDRAPPFEYILVYDVSRWGRFQNPDEGAMYQYRCSERGKRLIFVEKGKLDDDQALSTHLITSIERFMAAEYSRQLSNKVFYGSAKVSKDGYSAGGIACYGMSRMLLDVNKQPIRMLKNGEHKQISNERVTFIPSNDAATAVVKEIFQQCIDTKSPSEIANDLNRRSIPSAHGGRWTRAKIIRILRNEAYAGTRVYNKRSSRLKQKSRKNPRHEWIISQNAFPAIVSRESFEVAQKNLNKTLLARSAIASDITEAKRQIYLELENLLASKCKNDDNISNVLLTFPITICVAYIKQDNTYCCITISEKMKNHRAIFAIILPPLLNTTESPKILRIPTTQFESHNFVILSSTDANYAEFLLSGNQQIEQEFHAQIDTLILKNVGHS